MCNCEQEFNLALIELNVNVILLTESSFILQILLKITFFNFHILDIFFIFLI